MKKILFLFLLLSQFQISAQDAPAEEKTFNRQIGIDATSILGMVFSGSAGFNNNDYFLNFKKANKKGNFRFGFGGNNSVEGVNNGTNTSLELNMRFGAERYSDFGKHWRAYYGWDLRTNFTFFSIGSTDNSQTQFAIGAAPVLGVEFRINSRLTLSTEAAYNMFLVVKDAAGDTNTSFLTAFSAPSFVYLNFDF